MSGDGEDGDNSVHMMDEYRPKFEDLCSCVGIVCSDRLNARFETYDEYHGILCQETIEQQYNNGADWYFDVDCVKCDCGEIKK